jgi:cellulose synthase/poly-beta-1,6-N-acetylglucosamine synthase-like glycosyltransferase
MKKNNEVIRIKNNSFYPLISVIIASRVEEEIKTISSLKKQTYENIEVIIEYDVNKEGVAVVRNRGRKKATGKFLFFCDNDINLESNALSDLYNCLKKNPECDWSFGRFFIGNEEFNVRKEEVPKEYGEEFIKYFYGISTMSLIRASANPVYDNKFIRFDDWDLWITLSKNGHKSAFCNSLLFRTVYSSSGISSKGPLHEDFWKEKIYKKHGILYKKKKLADIIIPHHNRHEFLENLLKRIPNDLFNIILVSGGSFAENCNKGAKTAQTDKLIFLNDDTEPTINILMSLATSEKDMVGCAQTIPKYHHLRGVIFYGIGYTLTENGTLQPGLARKREEVRIPSGFCFSIKKEVFEKLGGFDEIFVNGAEDQDLGFKVLEAGYEIDFITTPIPHYEAQSEGRHKFSGFNQELFDCIWHKERIINLLKLKPMTIISTAREQEEICSKTEEVLSSNIKVEIGTAFFKQNSCERLTLDDISRREEKSVKEIFVKDKLQTFEKERALDVLKSWHRVLEDNGRIIVVVKNVKNIMSLFLQTREIKYLDMIYGDTDSREKFSYGYTADSLKSLIQSAGFRDVRELMPSAEYYNSQTDLMIDAKK